jgi:hypothetical protein
MRYCGRLFTPEEIEGIRELCAIPQMSRFRLSREVCERFGWRAPNGRLKDMSCRVALLRMQADGLFTLPPPRNPKPPAFRRDPNIEQQIGEPEVHIPPDLAQLRIEPVLHKSDSLLWNATIQRYHYLGHQPLPGAQLRYFVRTGSHIVAALGFGASAWKVKPRDAFIGWSSEARRANLHLVVNNARFLILPWIKCPNLASRVLGLISRRLAQDWYARYAYRPVLLETFVEKPRFSGTCYKAANWLYLADTQGRGKLDTFHRHNQPIKSIWVYPLIHDFRRYLCSE